MYDEKKSPMREMHEKFIMLAKKLGLKESLVEQIMEGFMEETKPGEEEIQKKVVVIKKVDGDPVDIAKPIEKKYPASEEVDKMEKDELVVLARKLLSEIGERKEKAKENNSPLENMMNNRGY